MSGSPPMSRDRRDRWPASQRAAVPPAPRRWPRAPSGTSLLTAIAVITVFPFFWMLLTSLKGPLDPISSVPPQFLPERPDARELRARCCDALPIPTFFLNSVIVVGRGRACSTCWSPRWPPTRWPRCASPAASAIFYAAAGDADRAGPADLHPELRPRGQRLPLLRHAAGADLPEPRAARSTSSCCARRSAASRTTCSTRPGSTARASGGSGGRSCCRSSGRRWRRSRSSRSSRRGTTSCGRR